MIKTVIFDMGGVIITLDENKAGKRFVELGMKEFEIGRASCRERV